VQKNSCESYKYHIVCSFLLYIILKLLWYDCICFMWVSNLYSQCKGEQRLVVFEKEIVKILIQKSEKNWKKHSSEKFYSSPCVIRIISSRMVKGVRQYTLEMWEMHMKLSQHNQKGRHHFLVTGRDDTVIWQALQAYSEIRILLYYNVPESSRKIFLEGFSIVSWFKWYISLKIVAKKWLIKMSQNISTSMTVN
jgi:hypothetical protein